MGKADARPSALVLGQGPPAAEAALTLAEAGAEVTLATSDHWLGLGVDGVMSVPTLLEAARHRRVELLRSTTLLALERDGDGWSVAASQAPQWVDAGACTACGACVEACPVELPGANGSPPQRAIHSGGVPTVFAIDKAGTAPCRDACPIHQRAQGYTALVKAGQYLEAYRTIRLDNPFPSVCGRVCNHQCEDACSRAQFDAPVSVMALKRFVADWARENLRPGEATLQSRPTPSGKRVAVVGSGPAGLTCALELNRRGHEVTVFESLSVAGGMMRVGIPEYRLPHEILQREIDEIVAEGVRLVLDHPVEDIPKLLDEGYDAVFAAIGAHAGIRLPLPGADLPEVVLATDFLRDVGVAQSGAARSGTDVRESVSGRRVLVLGGGNVAVDTAMTAVRLGADWVGMACLECRETMPSHEWEVRDAEEEGILLFPSRTFKEIVAHSSDPDSGSASHVAGVRCCQIDFHGFEDGRPVFDEIPGTEEVIEADLVIFAIGQKPQLEALGDQVELAHGRFASTDEHTSATSVPGLFAGGDVVTGTAFVVDAIAAGRSAAQSIDRYVRDLGSQVSPAEHAPGASSSPTLPGVELDHAEIERRVGATRNGPPLARAELHKRPAAERRGDFREIYSGLTEAEAQAEASRCLGCGFCSECLQCVAACPAGAIDHGHTETAISIEADVVLWTDERVPGALASAGGSGNGIYSRSEAGIGPAVDQALAHLGLSRRTRASRLSAPVRRITADDGADKVGVFLCRCGGEIEKTVDLAALADRLAKLPGVDTVQTVDFACHADGFEQVQRTWAGRHLSRAVLAACSCCALDQICYSCTTQRTRCKERFGVFRAMDGERVDFVNIREQCAFVHAGDPPAATRKAGDLVAATVAAGALAPPGWRTNGAAAGGGSPASFGPVGGQEGFAKVVDERFPATAIVDPIRCRGCEDCEDACGLDAVRVLGSDGDRIAHVDPGACLGCGVCMTACSSGAIYASDSSDAQVAARLAAMGDLSDRTLVFTCNWGAYSAIEAAGTERLQYDPSVIILRLMCAGRTHPGLILNAFAQGACRVLVLGCGHEEGESLCRYETGSDQARRSVDTTKAMLSVLGIDPARVEFVEMEPGSATRFLSALDESGLASTVASASATPEGQVHNG